MSPTASSPSSQVQHQTTKSLPSPRRSNPNDFCECTQYPTTSSSTSIRLSCKKVGPWGDLSTPTLCYHHTCTQHPTINWLPHGTPEVDAKANRCETEHHPLCVAREIENVIKDEQSASILTEKYGGVGLKQWIIINLAKQIQLISTTLSSSSIMWFILQTSLHTIHLEYGHNTNFLTNNDPTINISGVTPMWLTILHQNCQRQVYTWKEDGQCHCKE